jgi:hypothetical protein
MDESALAEIDHEPGASLELQRWYEERLRPRLTSALRRGIVEAGDVLALERDLRSLIGPDNDSGSAARITSEKRRPGRVGTSSAVK